jgi:hypothetical protein
LRRPKGSFFLSGLLLIVAAYYGFYLRTGRTPPREAYRTFFAEAGYVIRYLAGQTPDLVLRGADHGKVYLFHRGEVSSQDAGSGRRVAEQLTSEIVPTLLDLSSRGVTVVPVIVPTKLSLYRQYLTDPIVDFDRWTREPAGAPVEDPTEVHRVLQAHFHETLVDPYESFRAFAADHPGTPLYPPLDYHWASVGSALTVLAVVRRAQGLGLTVPAPAWQFTGGEPYGESYLTKQFPLPEWFVRNRPEFQGTEPMAEFVPSPEGRGLPGRVVLAGTSFSASDSPARFAGQLSEALRRNLVRFAQGNNGYSGAFAMMRRSGFRLRAGDLLVWELPLCCLNLDQPAPEAPEVEPAREVAGSAAPFSKASALDHADRP